MRDEFRDVGIVIILALGLVLSITLIAELRPGGGSGAGESTPPAPDLRLAPWAAQPDGSPTIDETSGWPSAVFPAGVDYPDALHQLYVASRTDGALPDGAVLADELPAEVVVVEPAHQAAGVRVSLRAAWGWTTDTRQIRPPSLSVPAGTPRDDLDALIRVAMAPERGLPPEVSVDVPHLAACQIATGTPQDRPPCG